MHIAALIFNWYIEEAIIEEAIKYFYLTKMLVAWLRNNYRNILQYYKYLRGIHS